MKLFIFLCSIVCSAQLASKVQLTHVVRESAVSCDSIRCTFSEDALLLYNPGFIARFNVPRSFKKKLFFCAGGAIDKSSLKNKQKHTTSEYAVLYELVDVPVPGLLIMCAYDAELIEFSWLKDALGNAYIFYFNQKKIYMEHVIHDNLVQYYAFNKCLPQIIAMC